MLSRRDGSPVHSELRATADEYFGLALRAHALLAHAPLHDVWRLDLAGGAGERSVLDVLHALPHDDAKLASPSARALFALRRGMGRAFGWDREDGAESSVAAALSPAERAASRLAPGTRQGPFRIVLVTQREAISEVRNATVHAFSVLALVPRDEAYTLYWAIHVIPVGGITRFYMRAIDPFRRWIIYPAVLRQLRAAWERTG